jgi:hypothetical protein
VDSILMIASQSAVVSLQQHRRTALAARRAFADGSLSLSPQKR